MKVAIVADWLPTYGGAEHVVAALSTIWPKAPIFTTVASRNKLGPLENADVRPVSFLQRMYRLLGRHQYLLPLMPRAVENIGLDDYDVVLSSSHAVGKGVIPPSTSVHVCYCHTPMRYAWEMEAQYLKDFRIRGLLKRLVRGELKRLRRWDLTTARRVDHFIANSTETQGRIKRIYGRDSIVVSPPVDERFYQTPLTAHCSPLTASSYFLAIGRLVPYKRFDLLIELANTLKLDLRIAGTGTDEARLKKMAGPTVRFLGFVADSELPDLYANASFLLFPQIEDAGIVPLEAQASGLPVIAFGEGGILDILRHGETGLLVPRQTVEAFSAAVNEARSIQWDRSAIRGAAGKFSHRSFCEKIEKEVLAAHGRVRRCS